MTESCLDHLSGYLDHQPVRIGNQAHEHKQFDVYGEMIIAMSPLFLDQRFLHQRKLLPIGLIRDLLQKIEELLEAEDAGLWEFRGREQLHTFTLLMHWAGAHVAGKISQVADGGIFDQAKKSERKSG